MERLDTIGNECLYTEENEGLKITSRFTIPNEELERIFKDWTLNHCPACFSDELDDGDIICDVCYEKAKEERRKYR